MSVSPPGTNRAFLLVIPALALLVVFFVLPYFSIILMSFREPSSQGTHGGGFTLMNYISALGDSFILRKLAETILLGVGVTVVCLLLGYPVAYQLARMRSRWNGLLYTFILAPLLVGLVVRTFGWMIILSNGGVANQTLSWLGLIDDPLRLMNNYLGVSIALVHVMLPFLILPLLANIQAINPEVETAARSLGASRWRAFWRVTFPLSMPGIQAGAVLVFILSISAYVTPAMLGGGAGRTMSVLVVQYLVENFRWPAGAALAIVLALAAIVTVALFFAVTHRVTRRLP